MFPSNKRVQLFVFLVLLLIGRFYFACGISVAECRENYLNGELDRGDSHCAMCGKVRQFAAKRVKNVLPSPYSELLLGTTLGINELKTVPRFNDALVSSGTIHVVVVSGYNVSLVFNHLINLLRAQNNSWGFFSAQIGAVIYSVITGLEPPVLRALIMVSAVLWARRYGRNINEVFILLLSAIVMLIFNPMYLFSLSFQLSFLATLGLVILAKPIEAIVSRLLGSNIFVSDFSASLSAQVFVLPLISYNFDTVNFISPIVNGIVLWTIPLLTVLGFVTILSTFIHAALGIVIINIYILISSFFINVVLLVDKIPGLSTEYKMAWFSVILYYLILLAFIVRERAKAGSGDE